jgi:hypothetical protein
MPLRPDSPAAEKYNALEAVLLDIAPTRIASVEKIQPHVRRLLDVVVDLERARDNRMGEALSQRIAEGKCAILGRYCLTHNVLEDAGHAYANRRLSTLD